MLIQLALFYLLVFLYMTVPKFTDSLTLLLVGPSGYFILFLQL